MSRQSRHPRSMEQSVGSVTLGDGSTANVGIFQSYVIQGQQSAQQALSFPEMYDRLHEISVASPGTCSWILKNHTFINWRMAQCGLFWIKGKPGTGKSTIMKYLWHYLSVEPGSGTRITASFFCHGRGVNLQKSSCGVYRALLHQIVRQVPSLQEDFEERFQARCRSQGLHDNAWNWTESELRQFAQDYLLDCCRSAELLVFVDALDECGEDNARELLKFFHDLVITSETHSDSRFSICVSSRHYPLVRSDVFYEVAIDGENLTDIQIYVAQQLDMFRINTRRYDELLSAITSRAGDIFQWCVLVVARVVRSLESKQSVELILQEIQKTPQELFQLYRQIVQSHMGDTKFNVRDRQQFSDLIQWVAFARRPLSLLELRSALSVDDLNQNTRRSSLGCEISYENANFGADIRHLSCGLVSVISGPDEASCADCALVQFIHHSVREYFVSGQGIKDLGDSDSETTARRMAELDITRTCYKSVLRSTTTKHPLVYYSLDHMFDHARSAEEGQPVQKDLVQILNFPESDCVNKLAWLDLPGSNKYDSEDSLLHIAARFNIPNLISSVLEMAPKMDINIRSRQDKTALHIAVEHGNHDAIDRLLDVSQAVMFKSTLRRQRQDPRMLDLNLRDHEGRTVLMNAARYGQTRTVQKLAQTRRANLNIRTPHGGVTALHLAIQHGHMDTAKILLRLGAGTRARDNMGNTPLSLSLEFAFDKDLEMFAVFRYVLKRAKQDLCLRKNSKEYSRVLISRDESLPPKEGWDERSFMYIDSYPQEDLTRRWLLNTPSGYGPSPLQKGLSSRWSLEFAQFLLDRGFDPQRPDRYGCVWHLYLSCGSNAETLNLLLAQPGANINFKDKNGRTLLARLVSAHKNDCVLIKMLLQHPEVDVCTKDKYGKTPLMIAAEEGCIKVVNLLLADVRSNPQAKDKKNLCALDHAKTRRADAQEALKIAEADAGNEPENPYLCATDNESEDGEISISKPRSRLEYCPFPYMDSQGLAQRRTRYRLVEADKIVAGLRSACH